MTIDAKSSLIGRLEQHLLGAADLLRGSMDASDYKEYISAMLFLKSCSELGGVSVPPEAGWSHLSGQRARLPQALNGALSALESANPSLQGCFSHVDFRRKRGKQVFDSSRVCALFDHFDTLVLGSAAAGDLLGAAYEYLLRDFADSAGKKGGEFYTPREVVRLMVGLLQPAPGMSLYDPCCGSGGMLLHSLRHVRDRWGDQAPLELYGQEANGETWAMAKLNMFLHRAPLADLRHGDTLRRPLHLSGGSCKAFDRILTNPPFALNYSQPLPLPERFPHGFCPEKGKKADLMFVQHVLASLSEEGRAAIVVPHGVLFRGGAEERIRRGMLQDDLVEAVIGLAPNLFYGTSIPAAVLLLRAEGGKPAGRRGSVLFVDASEEYQPGRAQNRLRAGHVQKILDAAEAYEDRPGFCAVAPLSALSGADLNIRRHVASPRRRLVSPSAHMQRGVPRSELGQARPLFSGLGFDPGEVMGPDRCFAGGIGGLDELACMLEQSPSLASASSALHGRLSLWISARRPDGVPDWKAWESLRRSMLEEVPSSPEEREALSRGLANWREEDGGPLGTDAIWPFVEEGLSLFRSRLRETVTGWWIRYSLSLPELEEEASAARAELLRLAGDWPGA